MQTSKWQDKANNLWRKKVAWITGDGQFALLAPCRVLTVTLWKTRDEAEKSKEGIDNLKCGGQCFPGLHRIVDLSEPT